MDATGLKILFDIQRKHNTLWQDDERFRTDRTYRLSTLKDLILGIFQQNSYLLETFNWSKHLFEQVEDINNSKRQLVDIIKYSLAIWILLGGDETEFMELFVQKSSELDAKWSQYRMKLTAENKVVVFDIDGVVADYDKSYTYFLETVIGLTREQKPRRSYSYFDMYDISRQQEEQYNREFIQLGAFNDLPVLDGVVSVMRRIKQLGIKVALVTARPSWIYKRLITDTQKWLEKNKIPYDMLFWDKDKADAIITKIFPANVLCMIEDRDKHALEVAHIGVPVLMIDKPYNKQLQDSDMIHRIYEYSEIIKFINNKLKVQSDGNKDAKS